MIELRWKRDETRPEAKQNSGWGWTLQYRWRCDSEAPWSDWMDTAYFSEE